MNKRLRPKPWSMDEMIPTRRGPKRMRREEVKNNYVQVGLTPGEKATLERMCEVRGASGSAVLRGLLLRHFKQKGIEIE